MKELYVITGPAGVGKSTVSMLLANKLDNSALLEGDSIYHQIIGGYISPWKENAPLELFWKNSIDLINNYLNYNYSVIYNYIVKKKNLEFIKNNIKDVKIKFIVLLVDEETVIKRDQLREEENRMNERSIILLNEFKQENFDSKYILDTTNLSIEETVDKIINEERFYIV